MTTTLRLATILALLAGGAACSSSTDPAGGAGGDDAGGNGANGNDDGGSGNSPGDGGESNGGEGGASNGGEGGASNGGEGGASNGGEGGASNGGAGNAGEGGASDGGTSSGGEGGASNGGAGNAGEGGGGSGEGDGIFVTANGDDTDFTTTPSALVAFAAGADSDVIRITVTAGNTDGATAAITAGATGANALEPGTYECGPGLVNTAQYITSESTIYQATGNVGECAITIDDVGDAVGDRIIGSFTATMIEVGGSDTIEVTAGTFSIVRNQN